MEENEDTSIITLRVNSDQRESIIQFINFNEWELEEMICEENTTGNEDIGADDFERTFCIPQSQNCDECEHCFCKPCITDGRNRQMWWPSEPALPDRRNTVPRSVRKSISFSGQCFSIEEFFLMKDIEREN